MKLRLYGKRGFDKFALVDKKDFEKVNKYHWHIETTGYPTRSYRIHYKRYNEKLHTFIFGKPLLGKVIDHINGNKLDNRKKNLRMITFQQNVWNQKTHSNNTSGVRGVYFSKNSNKWVAFFTFNYKRYHVGSFSSLKEAQTNREKRLEDFQSLMTLTFEQ